MRFGLIVLVVFALVCVAGSLIPQGEIAAVYEKNYPAMSGLILSLGLDDVFHKLWFFLLTIVLCVNLLGCNLLHFPAMVKKSRSKNQIAVEADTQMPLLKGDPQALMHAMGFRNAAAYTINDTQYQYAVRNRIGLWGAWLTHLGILIVILGFALGQMFTVKYAVYGVPGEEKPIGGTGYTLRINDFSIALREDDTVEQYTASLSLIHNETGQVQSGKSSVNHPWNAAGMRFYQNSTGWAADVVVLKDNIFLQKATLCAGEYLPIQGREDLQVALRAFYPDYTTDANGMPATASDRTKNPAYLYALYYQDEVLGMNILQQDEKITVSQYTIIFTNPRNYTLIQIKRDPFTWLAGIGGIVLLIALLIAFYMRTEEIWIYPDGSGSWAVCGRSRKGSILFQDKLRTQIEKINREVE